MGSSIYFKRWARKGFAIFNSLKKEIKICTLNVQLHFQSPQLITEEVIFRNNRSDEKEDYEAKQEPSNDTLISITTIVLIKVLKTSLSRRSFFTTLFLYFYKLNTTIRQGV